MKEQSEDPLYYPKRELNTAKRAIENMKNAQDFETLEDEWRIYLNSIEKAWVKAERVCSPVHTKFQPWQGFYAKQRKKDPLLNYLKHARNSDQHSIQESMNAKPASRSMYVEGADFVHIDKLTIKDGEVVEYKGNKPLIVEDLPHRIELAPITDSGKLYQPPKVHLSKKIPWSAPIDVAEFGLAYYLNFLAKIEKHFYTT